MACECNADFGNAAKAERIRSQLLELENTEKQLAQGASAEELFGSEDDPTGEAHRVAFEHGLPALRTKLPGGTFSSAKGHRLEQFNERIVSA